MKPISLRNEEMKELITGYLAALESLVRQRNALKTYDINLYSEEFYCELLSEILKFNHRGLNLVPTNTPAHPNCAGIDLIDRRKRVIVQVTSTATNAKVKHTFDQIKKQGKYIGYTLYFVFIAGKYETINLRKNRAPKNITCGRKHLLYPENLTALLQGSTSKSTCANYKKVLNILQYYLGGDEHKMSVDECFSFIYQVSNLVKTVDHVKCMCEEYLQGLSTKNGFGAVILQRINHQVSNHVPKSLPDLGCFRKTWARNTQVYSAILKIQSLVSDIDCTGCDNYKNINIQDVKKLSEALLSEIYGAIKVMCKESDVSEEVAFTELLIRVNEG